MSSMITKRPSTKIPADINFKAEKVLESLGISDSALLTMIYTFVANSGRIPAEMLQVSDEKMKEIEYLQSSTDLLEVADKRPRMRVTKDNYKELLHATDE